MNAPTLDGRVVLVEESVAGTELTAAASATDTEIEVLDVDELEEAGTLCIGDDPSEVVAYSVPEDSEGIVETDALVGSYDAEEAVRVYPTQIERIAHVLGPEQEEEIEARVPHALYDRLMIGIREDAELAEEVTITLEDDEYVVSEVHAQVPDVDAAYLNTRQDEVPVTTDLTGLTTSYQATDASIAVTPENDGKLMVYWGADVRFENLSGTPGPAINKAVRVSLLVDGVQVGQERRAKVAGVFASAGPEVVIPVSGATPVEVEAGVEVTLAIGAKHEATGTGNAYIDGGKSGGLSYFEFAA